MGADDRGRVHSLAATRFVEGVGDDEQDYENSVRQLADKYTVMEHYRSEARLREVLREIDDAQAEADRHRAQVDFAEEERRRKALEAEALRRAMASAAATRTVAANRADAASRRERGGRTTSLNSPFDVLRNVTVAALRGGAAAAEEIGLDVPEIPFFGGLAPESLGLSGRWEEVGGNFVLRPPPALDGSNPKPKAVLHFLGGAFVGAAPHLTYRYLLSGLAEQGFLVVATPYNLSFDYVEVCDSILGRFENVAIPLAQEYGALPVVGIGHSCGALLQVLITCLFPDTPRAANALLSFNNQKADKAIPGFDELVVPLTVSLLSRNEATYVPAESLSGEDALAAAEGTNDLRHALGKLRDNVHGVLDAYGRSPIAPAVVKKEVMPLLKQALAIAEQFPPLFESIADGTREFTPGPDDTREVCRRMYRARRTLLVKFENDSIDDSESLYKVLQESRSIMRMKRPLIPMDVRMESVAGSHITPLAQDLVLDPPALVDFLNPLGPPVRKYVRDNVLLTVRKVQGLLVEWLEEGLALQQQRRAQAQQQQPQAPQGPIV